MEESDDQEPVFFPPALVSLTPFTPSASPSPRRLSSCFTQPSKPVRAKRQLAWVSLQGRLVGAEEATSAKTIDRNAGFTAKEAAAWELFTPIQRVLVVAIVAAAAINSRKNKQIFKLRKSVELRDQVLLSMQQKLDNLCQQMNYFKDQPDVATAVDISVTKRTDCGCKPCHHHKLPPNHAPENASDKGSNGDDVFKYPLADVVEPEERRMSDLSDWAPSVTSSVDIQLDTLAIEHDISSLQKECEQKDVTINELSAFVQSSEVFGSKRVKELEDLVRRKNMIINKLRKDIMILEQKVTSLTRLRRPSFSSANSNRKKLPVMADNVLYDMDSTTSPSSSSDSDTSPRNRTQAPAIKSQEISVQAHEKTSKGDEKHAQFKRSTFAEKRQKSRATSPLKERSLNHTPNAVSPLKPKHSSSVENRSRTRPPARSREATAPKRWI
ncbi:hypothetical protein Salat_0483600 [Sesamum alatum]|uniref:Uncharacterized protein n=1 Tax=Sesamum alatum TaxID=300844 RepID=A0AAE1Z433_9LAMI|nr:hypothetical protein Salat_0483600 [Sesamum alatum]